MSTFQVTQVKAHVQKLFEGSIDVSELPEPQRESALLSRALAAYCLVQIAGADPALASAAVTDGFNDNGIDAIYYDPRESRLYLVQSKWIHSGTGEPDSGEIRKFADGVRDLLNMRFERFNDRVRRQQDLIVQVANDPATKITPVLAYTSVKRQLSDPGRHVLEDLVAEVNDAGEILNDPVLWSLPVIHQTLSASVAGAPIFLEIGLRAWGKMPDPYVAFYGQVNANEVADWWRQHGQRLFTKNLRGILGDTDVNNEIRRSLGSEPKNFWYYNNGVTIVAKKVQKTLVGGGDTSLGTFHCTDASIVNGAQTVSTIGGYSAKAGNDLEGVFVQVRLISLEAAPESFGESVTRTNNRQNRIESRDFVTLDPEQVRLQSELAVDGIQYHVARSTTVGRNESAFDLVEATTALACASRKTDLVVQLKREIGRLWDDTEKAPYRELFAPDTRGYFVWRCVQLQRKIDLVLDDIRKTAPEGRDFGIAVHGNRLIAMLVFGRIQASMLKDYNKDLASVADDTMIEAETRAAFEDVRQQVEGQYPNGIIPTLFKNATKCRSIIDTIQGGANKTMPVKVDF